MYEVEYCKDIVKLHKFLREVNEKGYEIIAMTEKGGYTILYKTKWGDKPC